MITAEECEIYRREGYFRYGKLFAEDEIKAIRKGIDRRIAALPESIKSEDMLNWHHRDDWVLDLAMRPAIIDLVEGFIGPDIAIFTTRILSKPAGTGRAVPWHQDADYWPLEPREAITFWLAVDDVREENGAMKIIPGGHREGMLEHVTVGKEGNVLTEAIRPDLLDEDKAVTLELSAGACSFHDIFMPHGSAPNRSPRRRCAFIVRYIPTYAQLIRDRRALFGENYPLYLVRGKKGANWYANG